MSTARQGPANPQGEELALQVMAVFGGAGAIAALPLLAAQAEGIAPAQVVALVFAFPVALIAVGRLREMPWAQRTGAVMAGLLAATLLFSSLAAGTLIASVLATAVPGLLAIGAVVCLVLVGKYLLDHDRLGGGVWLTTSSIALIGGFLAVGAGLAGAVGGVMLVLLVGCAVALQRLRRRHRERDRTA